MSDIPCLSHNAIFLQCHTKRTKNYTEGREGRGKSEQHGCVGNSSLGSDHQSEIQWASHVNEVSSVAAMLDYGTDENKRISSVVRGTRTPWKDSLFIGREFEEHQLINKKTAIGISSQCSQTIVDSTFVQSLICSLGSALLAQIIVNFVEGRLTQRFDGFAIKREDVLLLTRQRLSSPA